MEDWEEILTERVGRLGFGAVKAAVDSVSRGYREGKSTASLRLEPEAMVTAYLATRFPATRAAARKVAREVAGRVDFVPESLLDLGAGCGAAAMAFAEVWPSLAVISALERSPAMAALGRKLLPAAGWRAADFRGAVEYGPHDVVVFGYSFGEGGEECLEKAWRAAGKLLVIVEPGTPKGFARVLEARQWLIENGAAIAAPCPSAAACPNQDDWCHFAVRLNRSSLHRRLKEGDLGYEDEKYSYIAAWRGTLPDGPARVLRHPRIEPGMIQLELCQAPEKILRKVFKKDKGGFRQARKLQWGDAAG
jgi:ribosomal protein RSM22 (predicted rRNA methylase)